MSGQRSRRNGNAFPLPSSEVPLGESPTRARFEVFLEGECLRPILESDHYDDLPWAVHRGMMRLGIGASRVVPLEAFRYVSRTTDIVSLRIGQALQDIDILHGCLRSASAASQLRRDSVRLLRPTIFRWLAQP